MRALVTAGGTREPIDDVRVITNNSGGAFGHAIATELARHEIRVNLLASKFLQTRLTDKEPLTVDGFDSFADLERLLNFFAQSERPSLIFMAAAVADFSPVPEQGKIRSDKDELVLKLKRNPKLIEKLRDQFGLETFLVGFKLLFNASRDELIAAAREQIKRCRLNLVVANDFARVIRNCHPIIVVTPEGGAIDMIGSKQAVAQQLVDFVLKRYYVTWSKSIATPSLLPTDHDQETYGQAQKLLKFAQESHLLIDTSGNISVRASGGRYWITPRKLDKSTLDSESFCLVEPNLVKRQTSFRSKTSNKPSIDSVVHGYLYTHLPRVEALIHFHHGVVLPMATTSFPFPCGTFEEGYEILNTLSLSARDFLDPSFKYSIPPAFALELVNHGYLLGLEDGGIDRLIEEWQKAKETYGKHLQSVGEQQLAHAVKQSKTDRMILQPILVGTSIVGIVAHDIINQFYTIYILRKWRGHRLGDEVLDLLIDRQWPIGAHANCEVEQYYTKRGYLPIKQIDGESGPITILHPPSLRPNIRQAASVCVFNGIDNTVLLGKRKTDPWKGYWAFPGGSVQTIGLHPETLLQAAVRECQEETGIDLAGLKPVSHKTLYLSNPDNTLCYQVTNFFFVVFRDLPIEQTNELESCWLPVEAALQQQPMGLGTKRILRFHFAQ